MYLKKKVHVNVHFKRAHKLLYLMRTCQMCLLLYTKQNLRSIWEAAAHGSLTAMSLSAGSDGLWQVCQGSPYFINMLSIVSFTRLYCFITKCCNFKWLVCLYITQIIILKYELSIRFDQETHVSRSVDSSCSMVWALHVFQMQSSLNYCCKQYYCLFYDVFTLTPQIHLGAKSSMSMDTQLLSLAVSLPIILSMDMV